MSESLRPRLFSQLVGPDVKPPITEPARADGAETYAISMSICRIVGATVLPALGAVCKRRAGLHGCFARLSCGRTECLLNSERHQNRISALRDAPLCKLLDFLLPTLRSRNDAAHAQLCDHSKSSMRLACQPRARDPLAFPGSATDRCLDARHRAASEDRPPYHPTDPGEQRDHRRPTLHSRSPPCHRTAITPHLHYRWREPPVALRLCAKQVIRPRCVVIGRQFPRLRRFPERDEGEAVPSAEVRGGGMIEV
jgi:hypothetical protein